MEVHGGEPRTRGGALDGDATATMTGLRSRVAAICDATMRTVLDRGVAAARVILRLGGAVELAASAAEGGALLLAHVAGMLRVRHRRCRRRPRGYDAALAHHALTPGRSRVASMPRNPERALAGVGSRMRGAPRSRASPMRPRWPRAPS